MPVTVKFDPHQSTVQAQIIQDATPNNDGVMTAEQAAELAALVAGGGGGGGAMRLTVLMSTVDSSVDYGQLMYADPTGGHINISLPSAAAPTPTGPNIFVVKNSGTANTVGLRLPAGQAIDGGVAALEPGQYVMLVGDGVNTYIVISSNTDELSVTPVQTAAYNALPSQVVQGDSTAGDIVVNLPTATQAPSGQVLVKNVGTANLVNITPTGGDTVEGAALLALAPGESAVLISDGVSNWMQF